MMLRCLPFRGLVRNILTTELCSVWKRDLMDKEAQSPQAYSTVIRSIELTEVI